MYIKLNLFLFLISRYSSLVSQDRNIGSNIRRQMDNSASDLRFHYLRHEAKRRLFERGSNMIEVAAITEHKTLEMLKRHPQLKAEDLAMKLSP